MQTVTAREELHRMHRKCLDGVNTKPCVKLLEEDAEKILTIKKKLTSPEKERCVQLHDHRGVTAIDQKVAKQKERLTVCYHRKQR